MHKVRLQTQAQGVGCMRCGCVRGGICFSSGFLSRCLEDFYQGSIMMWLDCRLVVIILYISNLYQRYN